MKLLLCALSSVCFGGSSSRERVIADQTCENIQHRVMAQPWSDEEKIHQLENNVHWTEQTEWERACEEIKGVDLFHESKKGHEQCVSFIQRKCRTRPRTR